MTLEEFPEHTCKRVLRDINVPPLWSDDVRVRYANEGLAKIAELTAKYGLTPDDYRAKWGYAKGTPLVCKSLQRLRRKKMQEMRL